MAPRRAPSRAVIAVAIAVTQSDAACRSAGGRGSQATEAQVQTDADLAARDAEAQANRTLCGRSVSISRKPQSTAARRPDEYPATPTAAKLA